jgi:hypothetical protein
MENERIKDEITSIASIYEDSFELVQPKAWAVCLVLILAKTPHVYTCARNTTHLLNFTSPFYLMTPNYMNSLTSE